MEDLAQIGLWVYLYGTVLIANCCRGAQPTAGLTIPRQMVLGCIRGQLSLGQWVSQPTAFLYGFCSRFPPSVPAPTSLNKRLWPGKCRPSEPFHPHKGFGLERFIRATE